MEIFNTLTHLSPPQSQASCEDRRNKERRDFPSPSRRRSRSTLGARPGRTLCRWWSLRSSKRTLPARKSSNNKMKMHIRKEHCHLPRETRLFRKNKKIYKAWPVEKVTSLKDLDDVMWWQLCLMTTSLTFWLCGNRLLGIWFNSAINSK